MTKVEQPGPIEQYLQRFGESKDEVAIVRDPDGPWTTLDGTVVAPIEELVETTEELEQIKQELSSGEKRGIQVGTSWFIEQETDETAKSKGS